MSGLYSPPHRGYPQELPSRWKFEDGTVRTDLQELSDDELHALGWHGPIEMPSHDSYFTHKNEWNPDTLSFDSTELEESEKVLMVDYRRFWGSLLNSTVYQRIKSEAKLSLEVNVIATEFIALLSDARQRNPNAEKIQESLTEIVTSISFTDEELAELQRIFTFSGMFAAYTLS